MVFKIKYNVAGGHTHCSLFAAKEENQTFAKCGDFTVRNEEFEPLKFAMSGVYFEEHGL